MFALPVILVALSLEAVAIEREPLAHLTFRALGSVSPSGNALGRTELIDVV